MEPIESTWKHGTCFACKRRVLVCDGLCSTCSLNRSIQGAASPDAMVAALDREIAKYAAPRGWGSVEGGARLGDDEVGVTGEIAEEEANPCECGSLPHVAGCYLFEPMSCLGCATPIAGPVLFCAACLEVGHQATLEMIDAEAKGMPSFRQQTTDPRLIARAARING